MKKKLYLIEKKYRILFILFILSPLLGFLNRPANPYSFYAPDFENLLPFTHRELQELKKEKVKTIEKRSVDDVKTMYSFNEIGRLILEKQLWYKTKEGINQYITEYKYNNSGLLTVRNQNSDWLSIYDSITYDDKNRVISYYAYRKNNKGKKKHRNIKLIYDLKFSHTKNNNYILTDNILKNYPREYVFNENNQVVKIQTPHQIDSVSVEVLTQNESIKRYWYKGTNDTTFRLGQEFIYKNNLLQTETKWDKTWDGKIITYKCFYFYNDKNFLIKTEYENTYQPKMLYIYENQNRLTIMPTEIKEVKNEITINSKFNYIFY